MSTRINWRDAAALAVAKRVAAHVPARPSVVACSYCDAAPGEPCNFVTGDPDLPRPLVHWVRTQDAEADLLAALADLALL